MNTKPTAYPILGHKILKGEGGTRTLNALYDTLISGNHLPILRPLFSIPYTTILTDFRLHDCTVTIIYYHLLSILKEYYQVPLLLVSSNDSK